MSHRARAGLLLLAALGIFLFARIGSTQTSVEIIGLVRGDNALHWASIQPRLGASEQCIRCHQDVEMEWSRSAHAGQSCEACHGASDRHIETGIVAGPAKEVCTTCHAAMPGRPEYFPQVQVEEHYPLEECAKCHNPHSPAAAFPLIPHKVEGREDCLACHGVPNIARIPPNHANRPVELCLGCHKPEQGAAR